MRRLGRHWINEVIFFEGDFQIPKKTIFETCTIKQQKNLPGEPLQAQMSLKNASQ
jgi:hypothetical protein